MISADDPSVTFSESTVEFAGNVALPTLLSVKIPTNPANAIGRLLGVRQQVVARAWWRAGRSPVHHHWVDVIGRDA